MKKESLFQDSIYNHASLVGILAGVTRIELASAVLETVALPLCYTPIKG